MRKRPRTATGEPVVHNPDPSPATRFGAGQKAPPNGVRTWSVAEVREHAAFVEQLILTAGISEGRAADLCREKFGFGRGRYQTLKRRVMADWEEQDEFKRPANRAAAVRRIERMMAYAQGQRTPDGLGWVRPPNLAGYTRLEAMLADLQGTRAPVQVNVNYEVSSAIKDVLGNLTPEQLQGAIDEYNELRSAAEAYKALPQAAE